MSFFSKPKVDLEEFCRDFYDNQILNPSIGEVNVSNVFPDFVKKSISEVSNIFDTVKSEKLVNEIEILRFELFALAWTHKFISGRTVVSQSAFTKNYLQEKGRIDIWEGMIYYSKYIDSATLNWLKNLGEKSLIWNFNMRKGLTDENLKVATEMGCNIDESIEIANYRLWSAEAWKQRMIHEALILALFDRLNLNTDDLNEEAGFRLAAFIYGLYEGAKQSWDKIKIKK